MAMGRRREVQQDALWVATTQIRNAGHVFYDKLNALLGAHEFDRWVEDRCAGFYAPVMGRPGVPPGVYFRMHLVGYFEGIDSERGIAWRCADSLSLRQFLGFAMHENPPEHSTVSRTRRLIDLDTHREVFTFVLKILGENGLIDGKTVGVDATTLEANAALRSIVRRDTGESYEDYLRRLAEASGIATPSREELAKLDKGRKNKGNNDDWQHPHDPDARITKMKDGRTHLAHKAEQAVDLGGEGAVLHVEVRGADEGDTQTLGETIVGTTEQLGELADDAHTSDPLHEQWMSEVVADKGYHSNETMVMLDEMTIRGYVSEPNRGRRNWRGKAEAREAVYANRRRIRGNRGKRLLKQRGELLERPFAHYLDQGGMRRCHLRGRANILKRLLIQVSGFNLGLVMRRWLGAGTPRELGARFGRLVRCVHALIKSILLPWSSWQSHRRVARGPARPCPRQVAA
jgi:transposase